MMPHRQMFLVIMGAITWFIAAMFIRLALPQGWLSGGVATFLVFAASLPVAAISIEFAHRLVKGENGRLMNTAATISMVGLLLDGIAFVWASRLYTADPSVLAAGGAWLLWTVGLTLAYASLRDARTASA
jgi:hypothetical protein